MVSGLDSLRSAATREGRDEARAAARLAEAMQRGETLRDEGASTAAIGRAEDRILAASSNLHNRADRISEVLARVTPDEVLGALERDTPLVLLPLRLETRLLERAGGWDLGVRVFPDTFHTDAHEPELTLAEQSAGDAFWARPAAERDTAWAELVQLLGPQRASRVAEATRGGYTGSTATTRFTRPAWTKVLPDSFLFLVRADGVDRPPFEGGRVRTPLATGPDPRLVPDEHDGADAGMRWMIDFTAAVDAGMGARVPLDATRPTRIDQVVVFGVRASLKPDDAGRMLGELLDAHRYGDRLDVLSVGTATNAAADGTPPGRRNSVEATPLPAGRTIASRADGARLARALGVGEGHFAGVVGADAASDADAQAMLTALWPATIGYFLRQMLAGSIDDQEAAVLRAHALRWVRGRGPLAPLRVGRTPYGVLPATSLARYAPDPQEPAESPRFVRLLRRMSATWATAAEQAPKVGRGPATKSSETLAQILGLAPVSLAFRARRVYPDGVVDALGAMSGMNSSERKTATDLLVGLVTSGFTSVGALSEGDDLQRVIAAGATRRLTLPLVQTAPLSTSSPLVDNYLQFLVTATPDQMVEAEEQYGSAVLYLLARAALLQQLAVAASDVDGAGVERRDVLDPYVVVDLAGAAPHMGALDVLAQPAPQRRDRPTAAHALGQVVQQDATLRAGTVTMGGPFGAAFAGGDGQPPDALSETAHVLAALTHLSSLPSATLDRLLRETLDLGAYRFDAWVTSLATRRLASMRATHPTGAHLGAYGAVFDLVPTGTPTRMQPPGSPAGTPDAARVPNQGFLHAPSIGHAATAAVLRSAHAAHGDGEAFAVTLESARVRRALALLDGVRQGQSLAALLGYQLERGLLDRGAATAIAKLRDAAPIRTSAVQSAGDGFETIAPRDVVDGIRVTDAAFQLPTTLTAAESTAVTAVIEEVRDALDATGDLLVAEGVHQLVAGTTARAAAVTRAAAGTGPPPDQFEVLDTPRSGTGMTHRALLVSDASSDAWVGTGARTPRVLADPLLEGVAARLLGSARDYAALVTYSAPGSGKLPTVEIKIEDLGIGALDAVAMSVAPAHGQRCELERRVLDHALTPAARPRNVPPSAQAHLAPRADHVATSSRIALADLIVAATAIDDLFHVVRVPEPHEVDPGLAFDSSGLDAGEMSTRLAAIRDAAEGARDELRDVIFGVRDEFVDLDRLLAALRRASFLVSAALPEVADASHVQPRSDDEGRDLTRETLVAQGRGILGELERRLAIADEMIRERSLGGGNAAAVMQRREVADVLLDQAPPMAPLLDPPLAAAMRARLAAPPSLGTGVTSAAARNSVVRSFLAHVRRVRRGVARLDEAEELGVALGNPPLTIRVAQAGTAAGDLWGALPQDRVPGGITSLVIVGDATFDANARVAALTVDDWTEVVPSAREVAALAVHTDRPGSDAPQAVLLAVPPDPAQPWSVAIVRAVIEETLELAAMRMVDPPALGRFGHLLPLMLLACTGSAGQITAPERAFFPKAKR